jgi:hypothetical protein
MDLLEKMFNEWAEENKTAQFNQEIDLTHDAEYRNWIELGRVHPNIPSKGVQSLRRISDLRNLLDISVLTILKNTLKYGIKPKEVALIEKTKKLNILRRHMGIGKIIHNFRDLSNRTTKRTPTEQEIFDFKKIEYDLLIKWCNLNEEFLNEYYDEELLKINNADFYVEKSAGKGNYFPIAAGHWCATSRTWGIMTDGKLEPIKVFGDSKNQAIFSLIEIIKYTDIKTPLPFNPWDVEI